MTRYEHCHTHALPTQTHKTHDTQTFLTFNFFLNIEIRYANTALVLFQKEEILPQFSIKTLKGHLYNKKYPNSNVADLLFQKFRLL